MVENDPSIASTHSDSLRNVRPMNLEQHRPVPLSSSSAWNECPDSCCCARIQLYLSYFLLVFSSTIIVIGFKIFLETNRKQWLCLPMFGAILILFGASIYQNGIEKLNFDSIKNRHRSLQIKAKQKSSKRKRSETNGSQIFQSHLSINMLPQCFTHLDISSRSRDSNTLPSNVPSTSLRYLMLPLSNGTSQSDSSEIVNQALPVEEVEEIGPPNGQFVETVVDIVNVIDDDDLHQQLTLNCDEIQSNSSSTTNLINVESRSVTTNRLTTTNTTITTPLLLIDNPTDDANLIEYDVDNDDEDDLSMTINEAPPSYDEVIEIDDPISTQLPSSIYRTL
ncbi:vesicle-fusing ATPase 1-like [Sarcoptes scabiei]|nr:vesicle-fusing ATPase 1-like [Sarcoptes scabiei]